jgi:hypothetical protein
VGDPEYVKLLEGTDNDPVKIMKNVRALHKHLFCGVLLLPLSSLLIVPVYAWEGEKEG